MADEGRLRAAYSAAAAAHGGPHVEEGAWERLACGQLEPAARAAALDHASRCGECATIVRAVAAVAREARQFDPGAPSGRPMPRPALFHAAAFLRGGLAAAAAGLALWAVVPAVPPPPGTMPRTDALRAPARADRPVALAPRGAQAAAPPSFAWTGVPAAVAYRVELFDAWGERLWQSDEVRETTVPWPATLRPVPGRYYWRVVASMPEGGGEPSPLIAFTLWPAS